MLLTHFSRILNYSPLKRQQRNIFLHEYQSKELLRRFGLNVQRGGVASTPEEAFSSTYLKTARSTHLQTLVRVVYNHHPNQWVAPSPAYNFLRFDDF